VTAPEPLFDLGPAPARTQGRTERQLRAQLAAAFEAGRLVVDVDGALAESALILAAALDTAHNVGGLKGGYLAAQAQPPFQKACHALRLPAELATPTAAPPKTPEGQTGTPDWANVLGDALGPQ
jgi:hypothetical protein